MTATIDHNLKTITAVVPGGTDLSNLIPHIEISEKATISPAPETTVDFTGPVNYTITAEDGSVTTYIANITLNANDPILVKNMMNANTTLPDRGLSIDYIVDGVLYLDGNALLTVEPGVTIAFKSVESGINVGENAGLKMAGTAEKPIILSGPVNNDNKGAWAGIIYNSARADNILDYVRIKNAGNIQNVREAAIYLDGNSTLRMTHSSITGSGIYGIVMNSGTLPVFNNNSISECENYPIWCENVNSLNTIGSTNNLVNNKKPFISVPYSISVDEKLTLSNPGVPIRFSENLYVNKDLNLQKGVILEFDYEMALIVNDAGMISAIGDAENPVIFRGSTDEPGYWAGISIETSRNNKLEHCIVTDGGFDGYSKNSNISLWDNSKLSLSNVKLMKSSGYGLQYSGSINLKHSDVVFDQCALGKVYDYDNELIDANLP